MRAASSTDPDRVEVGDRPDPIIKEPTDAVVRVVLACVCGSDLWYYRGESPTSRRLDRPRVHRRRRGRRRRRHGRPPRRPGDRAVHLQRRHLPALPARLDDPPASPAATSATAPSTAARAKPSASRSPTARSSPVPGSGHSDDDAAVAADALRRDGDRPPRRRQRRRQRGDTVAVVGDGAVGLSAVLAAKRLGAERIIALSRHADRQQLATRVRRHRHRRPSAATRPSRRSSSSPAASASTPRWSASAPASPWRLRRRSPGPARRSAIVGVPHGVEVPFERDVLPQHRLARRPRAGPPLHPRAARRRARRHASTPAWSSTTRPTSTASPTPTPRWTSAAPSSRSSGWERSDEHLDRRRARAHRRRAGDRHRAGAPQR